MLKWNLEHSRLSLMQLILAAANQHATKEILSRHLLSFWLSMNSAALSYKSFYMYFGTIWK